MLTLFFSSGSKSYGDHILFACTKLTFCLYYLAPATGCFERR